LEDNNDWGVGHCGWIPLNLGRQAASILFEV
jgi:hypothetical protein